MTITVYSTKTNAYRTFYAPAHQWQRNMRQGETIVRVDK